MKELNSKRREILEKTIPLTFFISYAHLFGCANTIQYQYLDFIFHNSHWSSSLPVRLIFSYFLWWEFWNNESLWISVWQVLSHDKWIGKLSNTSLTVCCHLYMLRYGYLKKSFGYMPEKSHLEELEVFKVYDSAFGQTIV